MRSLSALLRQGTSIVRITARSRALLDSVREGRHDHDALESIGKSFFHPSCTCSDSDDKSKTGQAGGVQGSSLLLNNLSACPSLKYMGI
jgi:hypothetical protein